MSRIIGGKIRLAVQRIDLAIALAAYARVEERVKAVMAEFQRHLSKPVEPSTLLALMARLSEPRPDDVVDQRRG